jgi:hypothetical protein
MRDWFFALSVGVGITFVFFALGVAGKLSEPLLETLLSPGSMSARVAFGGLHGGEPILLSFAVNTVFYGMVVWLVMLLSRKLKD